jgi:hypothetical protein
MLQSSSIEASSTLHTAPSQKNRQGDSPVCFAFAYSAAAMSWFNKLGARLGFGAGTGQSRQVRSHTMLFLNFATASHPRSLVVSWCCLYASCTGCQRTTQYHTGTSARREPAIRHRHEEAAGGSAGDS